MRRSGAFRTVLAALLGLTLALVPGISSAQGWRGSPSGGFHGGGGGWHGTPGSGWGGHPTPGGGYSGGWHGGPAYPHPYVAPRPVPQSRVWVPGFWGYSGGVRVWIGGAWSTPPYDGWVWIAPHWAWNGYQWVWQNGYWAPPTY
jgi:hypothetical protein